MARSLVPLFLRLVLAAGLLSAVGQRFGLLDAPAAFDSVTRWTSRLWGFAPAAIVPALGWVTLCVELVLGLLLLVGYRSRQAAVVTGVLLLATAIATTLTSGPAAPFHAAVLTTAAAAFALHSLGAGRFSIDGR